MLLCFRDIKLPPPLVVSFELGGGGADGLPAVPSNLLTGAGSGQLNLASPGLPSRPSLCSTPGSSRPTGAQTRPRVTTAWRCQQTACCVPLLHARRRCTCNLFNQDHDQALEVWNCQPAASTSLLRCHLTNGPLYIDPAGEQPWSAAHTPHGGSTIGHSGAHGSLAGMSNPSMSGARPSVMGGAGSMSGLGAASLLSRRPSYQVGHAELGSSPSRQSSIMSMVRATQHITSSVQHAY